MCAVWITAFRNINLNEKKKRMGEPTFNWQTKIKDIDARCDDVIGFSPRRTWIEFSFQSGWFASFFCGFNLISIRFRSILNKRTWAQNIRKIYRYRILYAYNIIHSWTNLDGLLVFLSSYDEWSVWNFVQQVFPIFMHVLNVIFRSRAMS